jgi:hypothetical protein
MQTVAVQIRCREGRGLTATERRRITESVGQSLELSWLPNKEAKRRPDRKYAGETSTILLFLLGVPVTAAFAAFFKTFFSEAGKDAYIHLKKLIAAIWEKQSARTYSLAANAYLIFEFGEDRIAFRLHSGPMGKGELTSTELERIIHQDVMALKKSLPEIERELRTLRIGKRSSGQNVHIIFNDGRKCHVYSRADWD